MKYTFKNSSSESCTSYHNIRSILIVPRILKPSSVVENVTGKIYGG